MKQKKIAIVYDWMDKWGGVERMLMVLHTMFPEAVFYTAHANKKTATWAKGIRIVPSFMQKLPRFITSNRVLSSILYPYAFESFDFSEFETVITVTSSYAKGIVTKPGTKHISIILTPTRFLWVLPDQYKLNPLLQPLADVLLNLQRKWDIIASQRPDELIAISSLVQKRIKEHYRRSSEVVFPPFDSTYWKALSHDVRPVKEKYYLVVSRLEKYKQVDNVITFFNTYSKAHLVIIGDGSEKNKLQKMAGKTVSFYSHITDRQLASFYAHAEALIMFQEEDFGYVALEALSLHCPVISYAKSGAAETVVDGKTGILFNEQTQEALGRAIARYETVAYNGRNYLKEHGHTILDRYRSVNFEKEINDRIEA